MRIWERDGIINESRAERGLEDAQGRAIRRTVSPVPKSPVTERVGTGGGRRDGINEDQ